MELGAKGKEQMANCGLRISKCLISCSSIDLACQDRRGEKPRSTYTPTATGAEGNRESRGTKGEI